MSDMSLWTAAAIASVVVAVVAILAGSIWVALLAILAGLVTFRLPTRDSGGEPPLGNVNRTSR